MSLESELENQRSRISKLENDVAYLLVWKKLIEEHKIKPCDLKLSEERP